MPHPFSQADTFLDPFEIERIREWLWQKRTSFAHPSIELALVFVSPSFAEHAGLLLTLIQEELNPGVTAGCTSTSLISNDSEFENVNGFSLGLFHLPDTTIQTACFNQQHVERGTAEGYWNEYLGQDDNNGWIVFADPFRMDLENWLNQWNKAMPGKPILGGLATGRPGINQTEIYLNDQIYQQGGIGLSLSGRTQLRNVISQGCTPIGEPWIITKAEQNILQQIGNRPAYQVLLETVNALPQPLAQQVQGNLFVGLVTDEYADEFGRGDFLVRNLLGADPEQGLISIGALPRLGQTIQFQLRSPTAATEDLSLLLKQATDKLQHEQILGALLCTCNGRGHRLFGRPHHDAQHIQNAIGPTGMVGFFCNGELGPVGQQNFLHGYTASLALLTTPTD